MPSKDWEEQVEACEIEFLHMSAKVFESCKETALAMDKPLREVIETVLRIEETKAYPGNEGDFGFNIWKQYLYYFNARRLRGFLPREFFIGGKFAGTKAMEFTNNIITWRHDHNPNSHFHDLREWPGPHRFVYMWVELDNGYAVGWNENPKKGWSFPVVKLKHRTTPDGLVKA